MNRELTFAQAIREALEIALQADPRVICYGLGVDDPKGVFGTTIGLQDRFGSRRVFDVPASENALTGVAIGAALNGIRPVVTHQRLDFFLLAMDQLVNNAAKWRYTFGGQDTVPVTIRLIIGRGWGQGPTHSQSLHAWFAHVPGLRVVVPSLAADAKGLLLSSIFDPDPVVFLEHRWLHAQLGQVPEGDVRVPLGKARVLRQGSDVTVVAFSYMTVEALHAADFLVHQGISCDLIDLRSLRPLDWETVLGSVRKTGRLLALDTANPVCSVASEVMAVAAAECFDQLATAPRRLTPPDVPCPASPALTRDYYPGSADIAHQVGAMLGRRIDARALRSLQRELHDVPGDWFTGPF